MKKTLVSFFLLVFSTCLVACASNTRNMNTGVGAVSGTAVGALSGNPIIVLGGVVVGGTIGHSMNSTDKTQK
ncbi:MAG: hypothetical protein A3F42_01280 [Gammaproteobacteria bacterium RIFCSPHIGHO2_12_FULL_37_34]|nr:MAG: hypothetical protein A3F42_01280 [Gammaproteobacteria bacterium RIFCSPHIGHO2_12_FULL_37_34]